jgi:hypothetical protein
MLKIRLTPETITLSCDGSSFDTPNEHPQDQLAALNQALMLINVGTEAKVITEDARFADLINNIDLRVGQAIRAMWRKNSVCICEAVHNAGLRSEGDASPRELILNDNFCVRLALACDQEQLKDLLLPLKYKRLFGLSAETNLGE